jgi:hypothetical protein
MSDDDKKPVLELTGQDGNAVAIMMRAKRVARRAHWPEEKIDKMLAEAKSGDYDHVLQTMLQYFDVE